MANRYLTLDPINLALEFKVAVSPQTVDPLRLIIEDGTGVVGANSYASVEYARAYFIGRRLHSSAWTVASRDLQEVALRQASALLDAEFNWSGLTPVRDGQGLAWPFKDATDRYGNAVVGVPKAVRDATCELAFYLLAEDRLTSVPTGGGLKSIKVDVIEVVYADKSTTPSAPYPPHIPRLLLGLGSPVKGNGGTIRTIRLSRV